MGSGMGGGGAGGSLPTAMSCNSLAAAEELGALMHFFSGDSPLPDAEAGYVSPGFQPPSLHLANHKGSQSVARFMISS